jgi:hypothetical protein
MPEPVPPTERTNPAPRRKEADEFEITIRRNPAGGATVRGKAAPGTVIDGINLSAAPNERRRMGDTILVGIASATGEFSGQVANLKGGDILRLNLRTPEGNTVSTLVKAERLGPDTRNAQVALSRIGLVADGQGRVSVTNINAARPVSEPGARLRFVNERSGESKDFLIDENGQLPVDAWLSGKPGDRFSVRATDGVNNVDFSMTTGKVRAPSLETDANQQEPAPLKADMGPNGKSLYPMESFTGHEYFRDCPRPTDVRQGKIANCYLPGIAAAVANHFDRALHEGGDLKKSNRLGAAARHGQGAAAVAKAERDELHRLIRKNEDGTWSVTFHKWNVLAERFEPETVQVTSKLYVRPSGDLLYGAPDGALDAEDTAFWWPMLEKAYATWKKTPHLMWGTDYQYIGAGRISLQEALEDLVGRKSVAVGVAQAPDAAWETIQRAVRENLPAVAATYGETEDALYANTGVYANHTYTILDCVVKNGVKLVKLRNPWGDGEPESQEDKINDGIFFLPFEKFQKLFETVVTVEKW